MSMRDYIADQLEALLDCDPGTLQPDNALADIEGWDSVNQMRILVQLERELETVLDYEAFMAARTVSELIDVAQAAESTAGGHRVRS